MGMGSVVGCTGVIHDEIDCIRARIPDPQKCRACAFAMSRPLRALVRLWRMRAGCHRRTAVDLDQAADVLWREIEQRFPEMYARPEPRR